MGFSHCFSRLGAMPGTTLLAAAQWSATLVYSESELFGCQRKDASKPTCDHNTMLKLEAFLPYFRYVGASTVLEVPTSLPGKQIVGH